MLMVARLGGVMRVYEMWHYGILPSDNKQNAADAKTCQQNIHPDVRRQGVEEGEHAWICAIGFVVEDADA